ncbi:MAG: SMC-Scp complex subunit ScpB [Candidatus Hydrogenedentota bacterium]
MRFGLAQDSTIAACKRKILNGFVSCAQTGLGYCRKIAKRLMGTLKAKLSPEKPPDPCGPSPQRTLPAPVYPLLLPFLPEYNTTEVIMLEPKPEHQPIESAGENQASSDMGEPVASEWEDGVASGLSKHKNLREQEITFPRVHQAVDAEQEDETSPGAPEDAEFGEVDEASLDTPASTDSEEDAATPEEEADLPADMPGREDSRRTLHALLFVSDRPVSAERLANALGDVEREVVVNLLEELRAEMAQQNLPYELREIAGGYQLTTRPEHAAPIRRLLQSKTSNRLSKAVLETLAIVAYKQPVTRATVEAIRGVSVSHAFEVLQEKRLIKVAGVAEQPGRPKLYRTTDEFLVHFGIKSLKELPSIEEIREMG